MIFSAVVTNRKEKKLCTGKFLKAEQTEARESTFAPTSAKLGSLSTTNSIPNNTSVTQTFVDNNALTMSRSRVPTIYFTRGVLSLNYRSITHFSGSVHRE